MLAQDPGLRCEGEAMWAPKWRNWWVFKTPLKSCWGACMWPSEEAAREAADGALVKALLIEAAGGISWDSARNLLWRHADVIIVLQLPMDAP